MRRTQQHELFTTNYAVTYEGWQKLDYPIEGQFRDVYLWCNYYVYTWAPNYYLLVKIVDKNNKLLYENYINSISEFQYVKKKLGLDKSNKQCTEKNVVYFIDEFGNYLVNENNIFLTP